MAKLLETDQIQLDDELRIGNRPELSNNKLCLQNNVEKKVNFYHKMRKLYNYYSLL